MAAGHLGTIWASVGLDVAPLGAGAARARRLMYATDATMSKHSNGIQHALMGIGKAGLVMGAVIAGASVKMAADFDKTAREVATLSNTTGAAFEQMKDDILDLSTTTEHGAKDLMQAYYWITSAMPGAEEAAKMDVLNASQALATAGVADMADTADLVTTTLNAWGLKTEDVTHVTDVLFEIVKRGKTTIGELAHNWSKAASSAALMEVPIEDLGASVATLTRVGIPADRALMAMNRTLLGLNKATPETQKWIKGLGYENAQMMMKSVGLPGFLKALAKDFGEVSSAEGQNAEAMAAMFPNIRELLALLPLTGKNLGDVIADFEEFEDTTGNVADAVEIMSQSLSYQLSQMMNKVRKPLIELGEKLIPHVEKAMDKFVDILEGKNAAFNTFAGAILKVGEAIWKVAGFIVRTKPLLIGLTVAFVAFKAAVVIGPILASLGTAIGGLGMGFASLGSGVAWAGAGIGALAGPIGIAIGVTAAITAGVWAWVESSKAIRKQVNKLVEEASPYAAKVMEMQKAMSELTEGSEEWNAANADMLENMGKLGEIMPVFVAEWNKEGEAIRYNIDLYMEWLALTGRSSEALQTAQSAGMDSAETYKFLNDSIQGNINRLHNLQAEIAAARAAGDTGLADKLVAESEGIGEELTNLRGEIKGFTDSAKGDMRNFAQEVGYSLHTNIGVGGEMVSHLVRQITDGAPEVAAGAELLMKEYAAGILLGQGMPLERAEEFVNTIIPMLSLAGVEAIGSEAMFKFAAGLAESTDLPVTAIAGVVQALSDVMSSAEFGEMGSAEAAQYVSNLLQEMGVAPEAAGEVANMVVDATKKPEEAAAAGGETGEAYDKQLLAALETARVNASQKADEIANALNKKDYTFTIRANYVFGPPPPTPAGTTPAGDDGGGGTGGGISGGARKAASAVDDLTASWTTLLHAVNGFWDYMEGKDWEELNNQISKVLAYYPGAQASGLQAWWDLHGAMEAAEAELTKIDDAIKKHENAIEALTRTQRDLNDELDEYNEQLTDANDKITEQQEALSRLGQLKIKGETAADEKSFDLQHKSNELQLAILKAEKEMNFEKAAMLTLQKEEVDKAKELHDLQTTVTYEEGRREIEQTLDLMHGEEAAQWKIVKSIETAQGILKTQEGVRDSLNNKIDLTNDKLKKVTRQIRNEQDAVILLKIEFDNAKVHVDSFKQKIEDMSSYFLGQFNLMEQAARDLGITLDELIARQQAGGGGSGGSFKHGGPVLSGGQYMLHAGEFVLSKAMLQNMSPQLSPVITSGDTTVHVPVYLDSEKIAHATTRVTGANASRYARSGGRY